MSKIRSADIRRALGESPSTANELSDLLDMTRHSVLVGLWSLRKYGQVRTEKSVPHPEAPARGLKSLKLYELTPRGRAMLRRFERLHPPEKFKNRLLTRSEVLELDPEVQSLGEWEDEERRNPQI